MTDADVQDRLRAFSERLVAAALRAIVGVRTTGLERVPREGPLIVAFNHSSLLDGPLLCVAIAPARRPRFLGKKELFDYPLLGPFLRRAGAIPVDRSSADVAAMRAALDALASGASLGLSPEGTRVRPGERRAPKPGVGFLAAKSGAPVLPARLVGAAEFPRVRPMEVRFGRPMSATGEGREAASAFAKAVMDAIYSL